MSATIEVIGSKMWVINFYREQLNKFEKLGLNKLTEHNVKVTPQLIKVTKKRLKELSSLYTSNLTDSAIRARKYRLRQMLRNKKNGQLKHNGAVAVKGSKDIGDNGHEGSKS